MQSAQAFTKEESERLLEPWLGTGLDFNDLPVPRLIVIKLAEEARPDFAPLRQALTASARRHPRRPRPLGVAALDHGQHHHRRRRGSRARWCSSAAGLAVTFATRGAMAGNREVVEVLHFVGANDDFIAREFQRRSSRLGLRGSVAGPAPPLLLDTDSRASWRASWRASPTGDQIEALFGAFSICWRDTASSS